MKPGLSNRYKQFRHAMRAQLAKPKVNHLKSTFWLKTLVKNIKNLKRLGFFIFVLLTLINVFIRYLSCVAKPSMDPKQTYGGK